MSDIAGRLAEHAARIAETINYCDIFVVWNIVDYRSVME